MSIFKGKEVRSLKARVDNYERRLQQVECKHDEVLFYAHDDGWINDKRWIVGYAKCKNCGKIIKQYHDEVEFLKAKHEIMQDIIEKDKKRIAEIEKV